MRAYGQEHHHDRGERLCKVIPLGRSKARDRAVVQQQIAESEAAAIHPRELDEGVCFQCWHAPEYCICVPVVETLAPGFVVHAHVPPPYGQQDRDALEQEAEDAALEVFEAWQPLRRRANLVVMGWSPV